MLFCKCIDKFNKFNLFFTKMFNLRKLRRDRTLSTAGVFDRSIILVRFANLAVSGWQRYMTFFPVDQISSSQQTTYCMESK